MLTYLLIIFVTTRNSHLETKLRTQSKTKFFLALHRKGSFLVPLLRLETKKLFLWIITWEMRVGQSLRL